jgi:shikimate kinase
VTAGSDQRHIVLVGMMGAGKSTVGRALAEQLGRRLYDSDEMVEASTGRTVREIWQADGEAAYRVLETDALRTALADEQPAVIAAAGGVVLSPENRALLRDGDVFVVWLLAGVDVLLERVRHGMHRPLLDADPEATLRAMHHDREALYEEVADAIVSVDNRPFSDVLGAVMRCAS